MVKYLLIDPELLVEIFGVFTCVEAPGNRKAAVQWRPQTSQCRARQSTPDREATEDLTML